MEWCNAMICGILEKLNNQLLC